MWGWPDDLFEVAERKGIFEVSVNSLFVYFKRYRLAKRR